jgi:transglycosylase-like protein with SLT domain
VTISSHPPRQQAAMIDQAVLKGIREASQSTHTDFGYLMAQAAQESSFQPDAKAATSSATGLYQFIDSTWLDMVRQHGAKHGIGELARQVTSDAAGRPRVADPQVRESILALRTDPRLSAALAGEFAQGNKAEVERALGRPAGKTDLYLAHFLGAGGATELLKAIQSNAATKAADILPEAASANRAVFYDGRTGEPRTVADLYRSFSDKIEKSATAYAGLAGPALAATTGDGAALPGGVASRAGLLDGGRTPAPLAIFNAMMLVALKLLGGGPSLATNPDAPATGLAAPITAAASEKRRPGQPV